MKWIKNKPIVVSSLIVIAAIVVIALQMANQSHKITPVQTNTSAATALQLSIPVTSPQQTSGSTSTSGASLTGYPTFELTGPATVISPLTATYYVSTTGNDANPGTLTAPWRTIGKAARTAGAGASVYVRGGVYAEQVNLYLSGTATAPIKFLAYPGETPVVDASNLAMSTWSALFSISGSYVQATGFEVRYSKYIGVIIKGKYDVVDGFYAHHNQQNGILIAADYGTVQNSLVWRNALSNEYGKASSWASGLSAARDVSDGLTDNAIIRNNTVWENWGEGLSTYESTGSLIQGNNVHDNFTANIYISDSTNVICNGNLIYMTPGDYVVGANVGIMMGDERYTPPTANVQIINNIAYGNKRNFYWWRGSQGGGMNNVLIANNSFVNSTYTTDVQINYGTHQGVVMTSNIIQQDGTLSPILLGTTSGITFSKNLWSKAPTSGAMGSGSLIGDPKFSKTGTPFTGDWYRLLDGSPAISLANIITQVPVDYFNAPRGTTPSSGATQK